MNSRFEPKELIHIEERDRLYTMIMQYERMNLSSTVKDEFIKLLVWELEQYRACTEYMYHEQQLRDHDGKYALEFHKDKVEKYHKYLETIEKMRSA